jgi:hypothetical protein
LESQVRLEVLGNFTNQTLERKLSDEELGRLLVATDFTESDSSYGMLEDVLLGSAVVIIPGLYL